jgi:serine phosphatase RsbU (regulator of sigma subunit)
MPGGQPTLARVGWIGASTAVVLALWFYLQAHGGGGVGFFYAVPVGLTAWWFGPRWAAIVTVACLSIYVVSIIIEPAPSAGLAIALRAVAFALVAAVVALARTRVVALEHSAEELEAIRDALTPSALPRLHGVDAGAAFSPSEYGVSGDFYLLTNGPDDTTIAVVGDVVGHGPKAARLATFIRARVAAFAASTSDPAEILTLANAALVEHHGPDQEIASAVCLRYQPDDKTICWALAGHPPPLRLPQLQEMQPAGDTLLLGVREDIEFTATEVQLGPEGDGVLVYTDGATDVRHEDNLLGVDGLARLVTPLANLSAPALAREAQQAVLEWADKPLGDDLCLLVLRPQPPAA